jgi:hypothetical protein
VPYEARQRRQIAERCWQVYESILRSFTPSPEFHLLFPEWAELALWSGALQARIALSQGYALEIHEEYHFHDRELVVARYSYVPLGQDQAPFLRADPLPHHRVDYRGRKLTNFPHHLHDEHAGIRSFSGQLEDFLTQAATLVRGR